MSFQKMETLVKPQLSTSTVRDHFAKENYHQRVARKVPYLKSEQKRKRLTWAKKHCIQNWKKVMWSNECYVYIEDTKGQVWVTHCSNEKWKEDCLVPTFKQSSIRVMVWKCILRGKKGPLVVLEYSEEKEGRMNAKQYQEQMLKDCLIDFYAEMESKRPKVQFMQDGASSHTAKTTLRWLKSHHIKVFPHSPSFLNLNSIESVWHELKKLIRTQEHPFTSTEELIVAVKEV